MKSEFFAAVQRARVAEQAVHSAFRISAERSSFDTCERGHQFRQQRRLCSSSRRRVPGRPESVNVTPYTYIYIYGCDESASGIRTKKQKKQTLSNAGIRCIAQVTRQQLRDWRQKRLCLNTLLFKGMVGYVSHIFRHPDCEV